MAYDEKMAARIREIIAATHHDVEEKVMFSGLCFMVNGKMCAATNMERMMLRIDPADTDLLLEKEGCRPMVMKGKTMKGYVYVDNAVLNTKKKLNDWIQPALAYNKLAKASKKKKG